MADFQEVRSPAMLRAEQGRLEQAKLQGQSKKRVERDKETEPKEGRVPSRPKEEAISEKWTKLFKGHATILELWSSLDPTLHHFSENIWTLPYLLLLQLRFPPEKRYVIMPQFPPSGYGPLFDDGTKAEKHEQHGNDTCAIDVVVARLINNFWVPLCFLEIKPPDTITTPASRLDADQQMRDRFVSLFRGDPPFDEMLAISAFGPYIKVYTGKVVARIPTDGSSDVGKVVYAQGACGCPCFAHRADGTNGPSGCPCTGPVS